MLTRPGGLVREPYFSVISNAISALPAPHPPLRTSYNKDMLCRVHFLQLVFVVLSAGLLRAGTAAFGLAGPRIGIRVTRAGRTLPIDRLPNLQPGDRLWIHPDMPDGESVRFLTIAAFLRRS